jgi:hypothetical protein
MPSSWPYYCATFHVAAHWYAGHRTDEMFFFLVAMEPQWPCDSNDPGNWPEWLDLVEDIDTDSRDVELREEYWATAADYVDLWGDRDTPELPGVRDLATAMRGDDNVAHELRALWERKVDECSDRPELMGGPYSIAAPPRG